MKNQQHENFQESERTVATNIENPRVGGSIPPQATKSKKPTFQVGFFDGAWPGFMARGQFFAI